MDNAAPRLVAFAETGVSRDGGATAARTRYRIGLAADARVAAVSPRG